MIPLIHCSRKEQRKFKSCKRQKWRVEKTKRTQKWQIRFDDSLYFEDFERLPTFLGYPIQRKKKVEYVRYDRTIKASDIKAITLVRKRDAEKAIREKALNPLPKANKLISLFAKTVTQVELSSGELLYFELISIKEFEKIVKELKNGSI